MQLYFGLLLPNSQVELSRKENQVSDEEDVSPIENTQLLLVMGESGTGKSASLRNIRNQDTWLYANCEAGKRLPFKNSFAETKVTDPYQVPELMQACIDMPDACTGMIVDTITFLMERYESMYVVGAANTQKMWGSYQQYWKDMMQDKVAKMTQPVVMLGHTFTAIDDAGEKSVSIPVKGALAKNGLEAYFSTAVAAKKIRIKDLKEFENDLLHITEDDELVGYKHVFQTRITKSTIGERIRAPMGMWTRAETYVDNDVQQVLDRLNQYYA